MPVLKDAGAADEKDADHAGIGHELHDSLVEGDETQGAVSDLFDLGVNRVEFFVLEILFGIGPDHPHGGEGFFRRPVDAVECSLEPVELRSGEENDDRKKNGEGRNDDSEDKGELFGDEKCEDDGTD